MIEKKYIDELSETARSINAHARRFADKVLSTIIFELELELSPDARDSLRRLLIRESLVLGLRWIDGVREQFKDVEIARHMMKFGGENEEQ